MKTAKELAIKKKMYLLKTYPLKQKESSAAKYLVNKEIEKEVNNKNESDEDSSSTESVDENKYDEA